MEILDQPTEKGLYVAYINDDYTDRAGRKLLMWMNGQWSFPHSDQKYRDHVYGCIGPLPIMPLMK